MGQATDQLRASAIAGVMNELSSQLNGESEIGPWYKSLPPSIKHRTKSSLLTALQTLQDISDPHAKMIAFLVVAKNSESSSPATAIAAIYQSGLSDDGLYNHVNPIIQNWYALNPQAAANFLATTQIIPAADVPRYTPIVVPPNGGRARAPDVR